MKLFPLEATNLTAKMERFCRRVKIKVIRVKPNALKGVILLTNGVLDAFALAVTSHHLKMGTMAEPWGSLSLKTPPKRPFLKRRYQNLSSLPSFS